MALSERARLLIWIYDNGTGVVLVPFKDLAMGRVRYVRFDKLEGVEGFVFTELVD